MHGATASGREYRWGWAELGALPRCRVVADFHYQERPGEGPPL